MKKKILAAALAMTMMLGSSVGALATDVTTPDDKGVYSSELEIDSTVKAPTIKITLPTTLKIGINPYKMSYNPEASGDPSTDQIVCAEQTIKNTSEVPISVSIAELGATVETPSKVVLSAAAPAAAVKTKSAFLYFQATTEAEFPAFKPTDKGVLVVPVTKTAAKADILTLDADTGEGKFKIGGSVASNPSEAWTEDDKVALKVKFTFTPLVSPEQ